MKKLIFLFVLFQITAASASLIVVSTVKKKDVLTIQKVSEMSFRQYQNLNGGKLGFKDRIAFLMVKKELKKQVKLGNGAKDITPVLSSMMNQEKFRFKIGGFLAGVIFGIFGVGATYLITKDRNVHRSAWIGFGILVLIALISIISIYPVG